MLLFICVVGKDDRISNFAVCSQNYMPGLIINNFLSGSSDNNSFRFDEELGKSHKNLFLAFKLLGKNYLDKKMD